MSTLTTSTEPVAGRCASACPACGHDKCPHAAIGMVRLMRQARADLARPADARRQAARPHSHEPQQPRLGRLAECLRRLGRPTPRPGRPWIPQRCT
ncbi:hypothetical protein SSP24_78950 [Streptomyces spinoverrucosus]|uniref:Uncharacterized protein n=1 Tax=Streptomyces spinoverrucosus TaxID=284043 RepID=A0A4Y3VX57_9ACTN|nr:hypothetical protein [Streptomyces spinoverrucosus]GEC10240.1 hypothetical protein SSP24_78950 [Streptomyces spinoverrucosus]GHB97823.1 hypothetical protein GCM10010397_82930 [Streptomyces spinoverrucosus]